MVCGKKWNGRIGCDGSNESSDMKSKRGTSVVWPSGLLSSVEAALTTGLMLLPLSSFLADTPEAGADDALDLLIAGSRAALLSIMISLGSDILGLNQFRYRSML